MKTRHILLLLTALTLPLLLLIPALTSCSGEKTERNDDTVPGTAPTPPTTAPENQPETQTTPEGQPETPSETQPETEPETLSPEAAAVVRALLDLPSGGKTLEVAGDAAEGRDDRLTEPLRAVISDMEGQGISLSFILADLDGGLCMAYNADWKFTSQSTVKAPYITSVLDRRPDVLEKSHGLIKETITVSDNDAYAALRNTYGQTPFAAWCRKAGISTSHAQTSYPRAITVRDLAKLWTLMNAFFETHPDMEEYIGWFCGTRFSSIYQELGNEYLTRTKAGWESGADSDEPPHNPPAPAFVDGDPSNDETATNDSGIVYADHPYILVIFTNVQADTAPLKPLVRAIHNAHEAMRDPA